MATKITILGQEPKEEKKLKPIEFVRHAYENTPVHYKPSDYENIQLIKGVVIDEMDLMMCWDNDNESKTRGFILGHFNDGIV